MSLVTQMDAVIIEIRPGAGGDEAALFAGELFKMYKNYALKNSLGVTVLDYSSTGLGGLKEISFEISGANAYSVYKYEGGVHRVQRVPKTEKSGRVHTSTVSVAVLKKATEKDVAINPGDLRIEFFRSSGPGGQNVNKRETAVRIIHLPTGTVVTAQTERGQEANKQSAMSILRSKILENMENQASQKMQSERRTQIGSADRSEKIRTYNFPQDRITDHRIKKSWGRIDKILDGDMEPIVKAFGKTGNNN
ncbi:MAG: PCRF domain-containing protein [Candidatus Sungbacteria bacterium]|uniref:PCRF domain-containing protein n=1 Tax=Candidatus Sungiibacteriota bacterium TaxID=2750080 RepID=A0A931YD22_9BACT|nr:PCRF domain-containing protein [Candidatus Sungbacteria bacterium]MBI2465688.1 PCRF domain-containing protein [Candidatus Sungbacteria bacterium]